MAWDAAVVFVWVQFCSDWKMLVVRILMPREALKLVCWVRVAGECLSFSHSMKSTTDDLLLPESC